MRRGATSRPWVPTLVVLGVVLSTTFGGYLTAGALSEPTGAPVSIPGAVSVRPLSGWQPAEPGSVAGRPFVRLSRGSATVVAVAWGPVAVAAESFAIEVRDDLLAEQLERLTVSETLSPVSFEQGLEGRRFTFVGIDRASGIAVEGEVTTVLAAGRGVVFIGSAPEGLLATVDDDVRVMVAEASVGDGV